MKVEESPSSFQYPREKSAAQSLPARFKRQINTPYPSFVSFFQILKAPRACYPDEDRIIRNSENEIVVSARPEPFRIRACDYLSKFFQRFTKAGRFPLKGLEPKPPESLSVGPDQSANLHMFT